MVDHDVAVELIAAFPAVEEGTSYGRRAWKVNGKLFAWDRPFSKADLKRFGDEPAPQGPILGVTVDDLGEKEAILAAGTPGLFTIPHFDGYAAVLVQLEVVDEDDLREILTDGWLAVAPESLADEFLARRVTDDRPAAPGAVSRSRRARAGRRCRSRGS